MARVRVEVSQEDVHKRVAARISSGVQSRGAVVWQDGGSEVLVWARRTEVELADGYLLVRVPMASNESGRSPRSVAVAIFLGRPDRRLRAKATTTLDLADPSGLTSLWGEHLQAAAWGGLLDGIGQAARELSRRTHSEPPRLVGFAGADQRVLVEFETESDR